MPHGMIEGTSETKLMKFRLKTFTASHFLITKSFFFFLVFSLFNNVGECNIIPIDDIFTDKKRYNENLINVSLGLNEIEGYEKSDTSYGFIIVHGYYPPNWPTKGFEWTSALKNLASTEIPIWWFRHDWTACPEHNSLLLKEALNDLILLNATLDSLILIGHSSGGIIVTDLAEKWNDDFPLSVHAIAAPLSGVGSRLNECKVKGKQEYVIDEHVLFTQWRTDHMSDGLFRRFGEDPQTVVIKNGKIIILPKLYMGNRLGHNLSIQAVIEKWIK